MVKILKLSALYSEGALNRVNSYSVIFGVTLAWGRPALKKRLNTYPLLNISWLWPLSFSCASLYGTFAYSSRTQIFRNI